MNGEHAACGVGFVAAIDGAPRRDVVELALTSLARLEHRGGLGAGGQASDGAGLLTAIPWDVLRPWLEEHGPAGAGGAAHPAMLGTAVGMVFLPADKGRRRLCRDLVEKALRDERLTVAGWRAVPVDESALGQGRRATAPRVEQVVAGSPLRGDDLERSLLLARRKIGKALAAQHTIRRLDDLYVCSLSSRTIVYKGMVTAAELPAFYADLREPAYAAAFAIFHRRFSTNTAAKWSLAQPMRLLAHNGEINTLQGNLEWMAAREPELAHPLWGERIRDLLPPVHADSSDSGALDKLLELLVRSGRSPLEAMMMCLPEAYENRPRRAEDAAVVDFYDYYSGVLEHLSRRTTRDVDVLLIVSDATVRGITTAGRIAALLTELSTKVGKHYLIVNRAAEGLTPEIRAAIAEHGLDLLAVLPNDPLVAAFDAAGRPILQLPDDSRLNVAMTPVVETVLDQTQGKEVTDAHHR